MEMPVEEKLLKKINKIEKELAAMKQEIKKSLAKNTGFSLMDKYSHLSDVSEEEFAEAKKIWEPKMKLFKIASKRG
jgi:hypothetical protein